MAGKDYLAMYLQIKTGFNTTTHFIPIMHFAEDPIRLKTDIENNAFYTNEVIMGMAVERIRKQAPFKISVLFNSTLPSTLKIMRSSALKNMGLIAKELTELLKASKSGGTNNAPDIGMVSLKMGMKNKSTPYPKNYVDFDRNFTHGKYLIQFAHSKLRYQMASIGENFFDILTFYNVTGQIFMSAE